MSAKKQNKPVSYYDVLHVKPDASDDEIKNKYRMLAKIFHPDRNPKDRRMAEHRFRLINEAYSHLKTRERREKYNRLLNLETERHHEALLQAENDNSSKGWFADIIRIFRPANAMGSVKAAGSNKNG